MNNKENYRFFEDEQTADKWVKAIKSVVAKWVKEQGQGYWYLVLWVSKQEGFFLNDKQKITHRQFCALLIDECREVLLEDATADSIYYNLEKFGKKKDLKKKSVGSIDIRRKTDQLKEMLLTGGEEPISDSNDTEWFLEQFVRKVNQDKDDLTMFYPRHPYGGMVVSMLVKRFPNKKFKEKDDPSEIILYHCFNKKVKETDIMELVGRFSKKQFKYTKMYVASTSEFTEKVISEAKDNFIGLIRIRPGYEIIDKDFIVPRTATNGKDEASLMAMFKGEKEMSVPMIVCDGSHISPSLAHILDHHSQSVSRSDLMRAPYLTNEEIEKKADSLNRNDVEKFLRLDLDNLLSDDEFSFSINTFEIAISLGIYFERRHIENCKSYIDIETKHVVLSSDNKPGSAIDCFSLAHELGHFVLHSYLLQHKHINYKLLDPSEKSWFEHHANFFASCLLMPAVIVKILYEHYYKIRFRTEDVKILKIIGNIDKDKMSRSIVEPIAHRMKVSVKTAAIRLVKMGLAVEIKAA